MSYRSSPAFAVGGVSYLDAWGNSSSVEPPPVAGWTCYGCGETFRDSASAERHFGEPGAKTPTLCRTKAEIVDMLDQLREYEGDSVTLVSENPDPNGEDDQSLITVNGGWTNYEDRHYSGPSIVECLRKACAAQVEAVRVEQLELAASLDRARQ